MPEPLLVGLVLLAVVASSVLGDGPRDLTQDTFEDYVARGSHFVKFYAPWCGHCRKLAPTWNKLAEQANPAVHISQVDCTTSKSVCQRFQVPSYPTLLWIENGQQVEKYLGDRSLESLEEFVNRHLGVTAAAVEPEADVAAAPRAAAAPSTTSVKEISVADFEQNTKNGVAFVKFFAPWCGHCQRLASTWDRLGDEFQDMAGVTIAKVDCTHAHNIELCHKQDVTGYPTLYIYRNGEKLMEYDGDRGLENLSAFVKKHLKQHDEV